MAPMTAIDYVREEDRQKYRKFCMRHLPTLARAEVDEVWHYTNADGLILNAERAAAEPPSSPARPKKNQARMAEPELPQGAAADEDD
jgi:hypothetical protein